MKQLICEMCGSNDLIKDNGVFVCQSCGCKYSIEEARKMMVEGVVDVSGSTVKVDNTGLIDSYLQMAQNALDADNNEEAENYANKIIELDPQHSRAWLIKDIAAGWQTTGRNNRFPEAIVNLSNAYKFASETERESISKEIEESARRIGLAIVHLHSNAFVRYQSQENCNDVISAADMVEKQLGILKTNTGIDILTNDFLTQIARQINTAAVSGSNAADKDFGPENRNRDKFSWDRFTDNQDRCLKLLDKAYDYSRDDDLSFTICKNYILIAEQVRDSCSYTYRASSYGGSYVREYTFTDTAKKARTKTIDEWKKKKGKHDPDVRKAACETALSLVDSSAGDAEKQQAIVEYWQEHSAERQALEDEKSSLAQRIGQLKSEILTNPNQSEIDGLDAEIAALTKQKSSLGMFKGKEKKAIQTQIDALAAQKKTLQSAWSATVSQNEADQDAARSRMQEIDAEFAKERGVAKVKPSRYMTLYDGDKLLPTPVELVEYFSAVLRGDYSVKGSGASALENYTKTLHDSLQAAISLLATLQGKKDDDSDKPYVDNPQVAKNYRIHFLARNADTNASFSFMAKTPESVLTGGCSYILSDEKDGRSVADFIQIVITSIVGYNTEIDVNALKKAIAEVSFGLSKEKKFEYDGIIVTVTGDTKSSTIVSIDHN